MHFERSVAAGYNRTLKFFALKRFFHATNALRYDEYENKYYYPPGKYPIRRMWEVLKVDFRRVRRRYLEAKYDAYRRKGIVSHPWRDIFQHELIPAETSFLIIGGGIMGSMVAFWIKQRVRDEDLKVVVIERDESVRLKSINFCNHSFLL